MKVKKRYIRTNGKEVIKNYDYPKNHIQNKKEGCPICQKKGYGSYGCAWGTTRKVRIRLHGDMPQIGTYCTVCKSLFVFDIVDQVYRGKLEEFNGNEIKDTIKNYKNPNKE